MPQQPATQLKPYCPPSRPAPVSFIRFILFSLIRPLKTAHLAEHTKLLPFILRILIALTLAISILYLLSYFEHPHELQSIYTIKSKTITPFTLFAGSIISLTFLAITTFITIPRLTTPTSSIYQAAIPTFKRLLALLPNIILILCLINILRIPFYTSANNYWIKQNRFNPQPQIGMSADSWVDKQQLYLEELDQWQQQDAKNWHAAPFLTRYVGIYQTFQNTTLYLYPTLLVLFAIRKPRIGSSSPYPRKCPNCNYLLYPIQHKYATTQVAADLRAAEASELLTSQLRTRHHSSNPINEVSQPCPECGHAPNQSPLLKPNLFTYLYLPIRSPKQFAKHIHPNNTNPHHHNLFITSTTLAFILAFIIFTLRYTFGTSVLSGMSFDEPGSSPFSLRADWKGITQRALSTLPIYLLILTLFPFIQSTYHRLRFKTHTTFTVVKTLNDLTPLATIFFTIALSLQYFFSTRIGNLFLEHTLPFIFYNSMSYKTYHLIINTSLITLPTLALFIIYHRTLKYLRQ
ncbi:hypothetical protein JD969_13590 [Planctomycetota bacterium]|nr:hypothetical protein JD969_13590 [Planctomycetota bacterium]